MSKNQQAKRTAPQFAAPAAPAAPVATVKASSPRLPKGEVKEPREKKPKELHKCLCGCSAMVPRRFAQGHDAKLKGMLQRSFAGVSHPSDTPIKALIARFEEVTGERVKGNDAAALVQALNPKWERFLVEYRPPGSKKAAAATVAA